MLRTWRPICGLFVGLVCAALLPAPGRVLAADPPIAIPPQSTEPGEALAQEVLAQAENQSGGDSLAAEPTNPATAQDVADAGPTPEVPQRDIFDVVGALIGRKPEVSDPQEAAKPKGVQLTLLPAVGYNAGAGFYGGATITTAGWPKTNDPTRLSIISLNGAKSTEGQLSVLLRSDIWMLGEKWTLKGDWRYLDTGQKTYGLGPSDLWTGEYPMAFVMYRLYEVFYRRVGKFTYLGVGYQLNIHTDIEDPGSEDPALQGDETPSALYDPTNPDEVTSSGISVNLLADSRDSPIAATRGRLWNMSWRFYSDKFGSDDNWQELLGEMRVYSRWPRGGNNVLGLWLTQWYTFGPAPYLDLPSIGWDTYGRSGRAYDQGQIRATSQIYAEIEYRFPLRRDGLLGAVVFSNITASTIPGGAFSRLDPGAGLGLRIKLTKETRTNITTDFAWGRNGADGIYFGMREVF